MAYFRNRCKLPKAYRLDVGASPEATPFMNDQRCWDESPAPLSAQPIQVSADSCLWWVGWLSTVYKNSLGSLAFPKGRQLTRGD